ncbi:MAG: hypothetical protein WKF73_14395 [Nocardioidaceae bacterium]
MDTEFSSAKSLVTKKAFCDVASDGSSMVIPDASARGSSASSEAVASLLVMGSASSPFSTVLR